jgi:hypothetical protein
MLCCTDLKRLAIRTLGQPYQEEKAYTEVAKGEGTAWGEQEQSRQSKAGRSLDFRPDLPTSTGRLLSTLYRSNKQAFDKL